jgi:hypothetical protein
MFRGDGDEIETRRQELSEANRTRLLSLKVPRFELSQHIGQHDQELAIRETPDPERPVRRSAPTHDDQ